MVINLNKEIEIKLTIEWNLIERTLADITV